MRQRTRDSSFLLFLHPRQLMPYSRKGNKDSIDGSRCAKKGSDRQACSIFWNGKAIDTCSAAGKIATVFTTKSIDVRLRCNHDSTRVYNFLSSFFLGRYGVYNGDTDCWPGWKPRSTHLVSIG